MKNVICTLLFTSALLSAVNSVNAQGVITFSQLTLGGGFDGADQMQGWEFVPKTDITINALGLYDGSIARDGFQQSHEVAVWNGNGDLIISAFIPPGTSAPLLNNFRYADINPVSLSAGQTYVIGAFMPAPVTDYTVLWERSALDNGTVSVDPRINFIAYRAGASPGGISFPDSRWVNYVGGFGPSFIIAPVPEPGSLTLLSVMAGTGMLWGVYRRGRGMQSRSCFEQTEMGNPVPDSRKTS